MNKVPKGFLSSGENPTQNAVMMFAVYFQNGGTLDHQNINPVAVQKVREYFNFEGTNKNSFKLMLMWGLDSECTKSFTSRNQALAMRTARILGQLLSNSIIIK